MNKSLVFQKISNWPDILEGGRFKFFKAKGLVGSESSPADYFGSCWTLQRDDKRLFESVGECQKSCEEIRTLGSAAMWETYCKGGGLRVKTTIGKLLAVLYSCKDLWHGTVYYEPAFSFTRLPEPPEEALFHKRTCFRHEDEYRFIVRREDQANVLGFSVKDMRNFIDEILVSPSIKNDSQDHSWQSRAIYRLVATQWPTEEWNMKGGHQYCRISQMYGFISEQV